MHAMFQRLPSVVRYSKPFLVSSPQQFPSAVRYSKPLLVSISQRWMSTERNIQFQCKECGKEYSKWQGQCHACQAWNSIIRKEDQIIRSGSMTKYASSSARPLKVTKLEDINPQQQSRIVLDGVELNRVFGGGIVPGSLILIGGEPGIGKSSLLLRISSDICRKNEKGVLYVSGEESEEQVKMRCDRLGIRNSNLYLLHETNLDSILHHLYQHASDYSTVIIDSIQTVEIQDCTSGPGSIPQVRFCTSRLQELAKSLHLSVFITGHVTKSGDLAGPRTLEHLVDAVFYIEGDAVTNTRILRSVKNRFGAAPEVGIFEMKEHGLVDKSDIYSCFLTNNPNQSFLSEGSSVGIIASGSRALPIEFQSLLCKIQSQYRPPQSRCICYSFDRLQLLLAMLKSRQKLLLGSYDVFLNVVGGINVYESASDLPVVMSLLSSLKNEPLPSSTCFFGEIGLTGELRPVQLVENRLKIASSLGFQQCYIPYIEGSTLSKQYGSMEVIPMRTVKEIIDDAFE